MTTTDIPHKRFATFYVKAAAKAEQRGATQHRRRLLAGLSGTVFELGAGHGLNFAHYPPAVEEVIALEPEPTLRAQAQTAAESAAIPVRVLAGVANDLPLDDASVDAAVASLVLCSVPDQARALSELRRILRPSGELRFYEHVIPHATQSGCYSKPSITAACGHDSPAAVTPPATRRLRSSKPASRSRSSTASDSPPRVSSRRSRSSSESR